MTAAASSDMPRFVAELLRRVHSIEGHGQVALDRIVALTAEQLGSVLCTLIQVDLANKYMQLLACWPPDSGYEHHMRARRITLGNAIGPGTVEMRDAADSNWLEYYDLSNTDCPVISRGVAAKFGLQSLLGCPVTIGGHVVGYLNHYARESSKFVESDRELLDMLARRAGAALEAQESERALSQYKQLSSILSRMDEARTKEALLPVVLDGALQLTQKRRGWIGEIDRMGAEVHVERWAGEPPDRTDRQSQRVAMRALHECRPVCVNDASLPDWRDTGAWRDTQSALAVPLLIRGAEVRRGQKVEVSPKRLGVITLECCERAAFTALDQDLLSSLATHAALVLDRMDLDQKLAGMIGVQQEIIGKVDGDEIIRTVGSAIASVFQYDYVNISVVHPEKQTIETEHVIGLPQGSLDEFRQRARHRLDSTDIQADIVRSREIEVLSQDDPRFDKTIYQPFGHDQLTRVFMPMIAASDDRVIGTVEVGHRRTKWHEIYEEDVRILKQFVDYAAAALERRRRGILDEITHELRAPVVGIRSNLSFVQDHFDRLSPDFVLRKLDDMLIDCEMLLHQIRELDYFLGRPPQVPKIERTLVLRDILLGAVRALKSQVQERGLDPSRIEYDQASFTRMGALYIDRDQFRQVVSHLLINAVKYAEDEPDQFRIFIAVKETAEHFILSFSDWGIGIEPEHQARIFDTGFRTPGAVAHLVSGSGLGLAIGRRIMHDMGGDLRLDHLRKPTEFHIVLPRQLQEEHRDSVH